MVGYLDIIYKFVYVEGVCKINQTLRLFLWP